MPKNTSFYFQENQIHTSVVKIKQKHCVAAVTIYFQEKVGTGRFIENHDVKIYEKRSIRKVTIQWHAHNKLNRT
jgi:hypothetical protein